MRARRLPHARPGELDALLQSTRRRGPEVVIVPDRHGTGTNGLLLAPPDAIAPSFGPGSCERHRALARAAGVALPRRAGALAAARHRHRRRPRRAATRDGRGATRPCRAHARRARPARTHEYPLHQHARPEPRAMASLCARGLPGLPEVRAGDDLAALIVAALDGDGAARRTARGDRAEGRLQVRGRGRGARRRAPERARDRARRDGARRSRRRTRAPCRSCSTSPSRCCAPSAAC